MTYPTTNPPLTSQMLDNRADGSPELTAHVLLPAAMAVVAVALTVFLMANLAVPPILAVTAGLCVFVASVGLHVWLAGRHVSSHETQAAAARKVRRRPVQNDVNSVRPTQPTASNQQQAAVQAEKRIEPSDLALELLAKAADTAAAAAQAPTPPPIGSEPETELQRVDRLVRKLVDRVNHQPQLTGAADPVALKQSIWSEPSSVEPVQDQSLEPLAAQLAASIEALKADQASTVRSQPSLAPPPLPTAPAAQVAPPAERNRDLNTAIAGLPKRFEAGPLEPELERSPAQPTTQNRTDILAALNSQRIDVFLEPILDLADQRPQHYEVAIGLRGSEGGLINLADTASELSGTGLLPLIDSARIVKAAQVARRLADRGKSGSVLTALSGESLYDADFQATFAGQETVGAFPGQLVLTLSQAHVSCFTIADWRTLARLRAAGFGFALADVTSLDMDFAALASVGFSFARLDASTFLTGLPTSDGIVPPSDICRHIAAAGLALIVGGIIDDHQLARIFGFGVLLGQGQLFGGKRPVSTASTQVASDQRAAATAAE